MKLFFEKAKDNPLNLLRKLGYSFQRRDERTGEMSFVKLMGGGNYPRFHIYAGQDERGAVRLNLHIDQKKASYAGSTAHSGEYEIEDNEWLRKEAEEIGIEFSK